MSFVFAALLVSVPFVLAATITAVSDALRDAGVRAPRVMREGPWRHE